MALPKLNRPQFEFEIPSTKQDIKVVPYLTRDEKILLIAKESGEYADTLRATKQIVANCIVDKGIVVDNLALFDVEYLFLKLRSISVSSTAKVSFRDVEDEKVRDFDVVLDDVKVKFPDKDMRIIPVSDSVSIQLRYPSSTLYNDKTFMGLKGEAVFDTLLLKSIDKITENDAVTAAAMVPTAELKTWLDDLPVKVYDDIKTFFVTLPTLNYEITYTNTANTERKIVLSTLSDFFPF